MKRLCAAVAVSLIAAGGARAADRFRIIPSLAMTQVDDDNLNFSPADPLRDRIRRITPELALRVDSARTAAALSAAMDSEEYASRPSLNNSHARERAQLGLQFRATPRLTVAFDGNYVNTNTVADLNTETALAASRLRGHRFSASPSALFRISPTMTARASASFSTTSVANGLEMRTHTQSLGFDRRVTRYDTLSLDYTSAELIFRGDTSQIIRTDALLAGWTRDLGKHDRLIVHAGPRRTDRSYSADLAASLTHTAGHAAFGVSAMRGQTTVVGYAGAVLTDSIQGNVAYSPLRTVSLIAGPAIYRTTHNELQGMVYRISGGARFALTSFAQLELLYNHDTQDGAIDPLLAGLRFSHSTLSIGLVTGRKDAAR